MENQTTSVKLQLPVDVSDSPSFDAWVTFPLPAVGPGPAHWETQNSIEPTTNLESKQ